VVLPRPQSLCADLGHNIRTSLDTLQNCRKSRTEKKEANQSELVERKEVEATNCWKIKYQKNKKRLQTGQKTRRPEMPLTYEDAAEDEARSHETATK